MGFRTCSNRAVRCCRWFEDPDATLDGTRKDYLKRMQQVPLLVIDDLGLRQLPKTAAEDLLELVMRRYERTSTVFSSNRAVDEWGKLLGDSTATGALLDRLLHHAHVVQCGPKSYRMLRKSREVASA